MIKHIVSKEFLRGSAPDMKASCMQDESAAGAAVSRAELLGGAAAPADLAAV